MASKKDGKSKGKKLQVKKLKVTDLPAGRAADAKGGKTYSCAGALTYSCAVALTANCAGMGGSLTSGGTLTQNQ